MKKAAILFLITLFSLTVFAQKPKSVKKTNSVSTQTKPVKETPTPSPTPVELDEAEELDLAIHQATAPERIAALHKFLENFPETAEKTRIFELMVSARAEIGEEKLRSGEIEQGVESFKLAVKEAPTPFSEELFTKVLLQFPTNLFFRGQRDAAVLVAKMIEEKIDGNAKQYLGLAAFYIGTENAAQAKRLAEKVIQAEESRPSENADDAKANLKAAYQTLGLAYRLRFQLDESANAYAKALEVDPESIVSMRSLAEMKRSTGKADEAVEFYQRVLAKDETDNLARTGLVLSLFDAGRKSEAESEMAKSLEKNPENLFLLTGAAYWYAAHKNGEKAVELARKALAVEPRYTWAHIALARGLMEQKKPVEAEQTLLTARQYGNFPTLDYEIATAKMQAGFFREAVDQLKKTISLKNGVLETWLGNRILVEADNFSDLLRLERQASIFETKSADTPENAERLKSLLELSQKIESAEATDLEIAEAAGKFVSGDDNMKLHRQLFVANRLLAAKKALPKAFELTQAAVGGIDAALNIPSPSSAVMADALYETRTYAISKSQFVLAPDVPRQTLARILRGRIEETAGWILLHENKPAEAVVRLKRAVSILPEDSTWWRSSTWRLGAALESDGKDREALDEYIKSYKSGDPETAKRIVIESLYEKVNGNLNGLDEKIGAKPEAVAQATATPTPEPTPEVEAASRPVPDLVPAADETPKPSPTIEDFSTKIPETSPIPQSSPVVEPLPTPTPEITPTPETEPTPVETPTPETTEETPAPTPTPEISPTPETIEETPTPTPEITPETTSETEPTPEETPVPTLEILPTPTPETSPTPETEKEEVTAPTPTPTPEVLPTPVFSPETLPVVLPTPEETNLAGKNETKPDDKTVSANNPKSIFDPIVINIPKSEIKKPVKPLTKPAEEADKPNEKRPEETDESSIEKSGTDSADKPKIEPENSPKNKTDKTAPAENPFEERLVLGAIRPRIVPIKKAETETIEKCEIVVSQENISILNGGGSLGILVGYADEGDLKQIKAKANSPQDIQVIFDPQIGSLSNRAFFVIKSISKKLGVYSVIFEAPCGKKEVQVKVR